MSVTEADIVGLIIVLEAELWPALVATDSDCGQHVPLPHGRMLGGTSAMNGMAFIANSRANVDTWGALGNEGWNWATFSPYYRKISLTLSSEEKIKELGLEYVDPKLNGIDGPLQALGLGYPMSSDPFSGDGLGGYTNAAAIDPARSFSANAYYLPAKGHPNLHVVSEALGDTEFTVKALREVIISVGIFNSPKVLELSGIGSLDTLEKFNTPVVVDNPNVGENLQDHPLPGVIFEVQVFINTKDNLMRNYSSTLLPLSDFSKPDTGSEDLATILAATVPDSSSADFAAFIRSILQNPREATGGYFTYPARRNSKGSSFPENYITICSFLLYPLSRGICHVSSADPAKPPIVDPRYLSHPADLEMSARHTRFIDAIASSQPLACMLKPGGKRSPGVPDDLRTASLDEVKDYVKSAGRSTYHATSTCAMLPREEGGVVDSRLRVWGTKGLRVVDASVIPIAPKANPQTMVYALAERAVDLIKEDLAGK
ncbi:alcohol oxidase [Aspergillus sclerotioniger CBS 115572]|uniref:glucose oxidase n=1 Tax=Aspergillus sclerotioniger CBS 115572 TaxID=1450535 RepID=A0A317V0G8_9EURO|nr:alcohol oxidase [Aspergillus sclerotioniger CBS 115572]PWY65670.1 alcohol oxidase [Aspergillus sclerotioniger CBS 115572]